MKVILKTFIIEDNLDKFISDRNNMLLKNNNINFIEQNSKN